MKKILLGTSAVALAFAITPAQSAEWEMTVGGFFTGGVGLASDEVQTDQPVVLTTDAEVTFRPRLTLDNGLQFGADFELEAQNGADGNTNLDEASMFVSGSFGKVEIGAQDGAGDKFGGGLPCPTFTCSDDGIFDRNGFSSIGVDGADSSDDTKISYFTPTFAGFAAGVSYIPTDGDNNTITPRGASDDNSIEAGAGYSNSFGDISVNVGFSYYYDGSAEDNNFGGTLGVGFAGFTIGGGYENNDDGDFSAWGVGLTYDTGPWNFGVHFADVIEDGGNDSDEYNGGVGVSYELASGVTAGAAFEFGEQNNSTDTAFAGGGYLAISF